MTTTKRQAYIEQLIKGKQGTNEKIGRHIRKGCGTTRMGITQWIMNQWISEQWPTCQSPVPVTVHSRLSRNWNIYKENHRHPKHRYRFNCLDSGLKKKKKSLFKNGLLHNNSFFQILIINLDMLLSASLTIFIILPLALGLGQKHPQNALDSEKLPLFSMFKLPFMLNYQKKKKKEILHHPRALQ